MNVQLFNADLPARSKCNQFVGHNGYYACTRCLARGSRCGGSCGSHTVYTYSDLAAESPLPRNGKDIHVHANQAAAGKQKVMGLVGISPLSSIISIPFQSVFDYMHLVLEIHFR